MLLILLVLIAFVLPFILPSERIKNTQVHGLIIRDQVWSGTIRIDGDIMTMPGTSITVEPGTSIIVSKTSDKSNFDFLPWHNKSGINTGPFDHGVLTGDPFWDESQKISLRFYRFYALGTEKFPVIFTSDGSQGSRFDINQISIQRGMIDHTQFSNYRKFKIGDQVVIKNSQFKNSDECSICISGGKPQILSSTFKDGFKGYIRVDGGSPQIRGDIFHENNSDGITYWGDNSSVIVTENFFQIPSEKVIKISSSMVDGTIARNYISSGDIELACNSKVKVLHNYIKTRIVFKSDNNCQGKYVVDQNYWDTTQKDQILNARVVGITPEFKVEIPFILTKPPTGVADRVNLGHEQKI